MRINEVGQMNRRASKNSTPIPDQPGDPVNIEQLVFETQKILTPYPKRRVLSDSIPDNKLKPRDKLLKVLFVVVYLMALSGLGFALSIYYLFFWDSTMPPVYKPTKKFF